MGERFGKYELLRKLAVGGMAEIFFAQHIGPEGFSKNVAIKRILPHLTEDPDFVTMFLDEARLVARFNHPNIVQIFELGQVANVFFLAMEYVNGASMSKVIKACKQKQLPFPAAYGARICSLACEGLEYAHNFTDPDGTPLNLIHRDVSPQNIMLSYDGAVKVLDFGIAKAAANVYKTRTTSLKGKAAYMSPEQITMKTGLDRRSDVFSLGIVLYEFVTGQRPFTGETELDLMMAIVRDPPRDPREHVPDLPKELADIILYALRKDRRQRYQSAREMQMELEKFLVSKKTLIDSYILGSFLRQVLPPSEAQPGAHAATPSRPQVAPQQLDPASLAKQPPPPEVARRTPTSKSGKSAPKITIPPPPGDEAPTMLTPSSQLPRVENQEPAIAATSSLPDIEVVVPSKISWLGQHRQLVLLSALAVLLVVGGALAAFLAIGEPEPALFDATLEPVPPQPPPVVVVPPPPEEAAPSEAQKNVGVGESPVTEAGQSEEKAAVAAAEPKPPATETPSGAAKPGREPKKPGREPVRKNRHASAPERKTPPESTPPPSVKQPEVAVVEPAAKGSLMIFSSPWVDVKIDGVSYGVTPWQDGAVKLDAGPHLVEMKNPDGILHREKVQILPGKETVLRRKFQKGFLQVFVKPFGEIYINGIKKGDTPLAAPLELYEGSVRLRVYCPSTGKEFTKLVNIKPSETITEKIDLR